MCFLYSQFFLFTFFPVHSICAYFLLFFLYSQFFLCRFSPVHSLCAYFLFTILSAAGCTWWRGTLQEASMLSLDKKRKKKKRNQFTILSLASACCHFKRRRKTKKERKKKKSTQKWTRAHVVTFALISFSFFLPLFFSFSSWYPAWRQGKP